MSDSLGSSETVLTMPFWQRLCIAFIGIPISGFLMLYAFSAPEFFWYAAFYLIPPCGLGFVIFNKDGFLAPVIILFALLFLYAFFVSSGGPMRPEADY